MSDYTTLGGRAICTQCSAKSKRSQERCRNPAMKGKNICLHHGGRSRGSTTKDGRARQIAANTKHGNETRAIREERSAKLAELYEIEKKMRSMGMVEGSWVSRKPPTN